MASKFCRGWILLGLLLTVGQAISAPADPEDQVALYGVAVYRTLTDSIRIRVTDDNCQGVVAVPDSADGFSTVDTTTYGFRLEPDTLENTWKLPEWKRRPASDDGRQSFTLYLLNTSGADTMVQRQVLLDHSRAKLGSVDEEAILDGEVSPLDIDSTATGWNVARLSADAYRVPEVANNAVGINADYGTDNSTGKVFRISGVRSGSGLGRGLSFESWGGPAIWLSRNASTGSSSSAISLDMSTETGGTIAYGYDADIGGNGNVAGGRILRGDGYRDYTTYGLVIDATAGATTDSLGINYGLYARAKTSVSNGATNVAVYAEANGTNGKALHSLGESHLDGWVRWSKHIDVNLLDADSLQTFTFTGVDTSCRCWGTLRTADGLNVRPMGITVPSTDNVTVVLNGELPDTVSATIWCTR